MDITFNSLEELYTRLKPALNTKRAEMQRNGYKYITIEDIWNYLEQIKWKNSKNLSLYEMVNDVLNCDDYAVDKYFKDKLNSKERTVYFNLDE